MTSKRLEIFDQRFSIVGRQGRPDDALDLLFLAEVLSEFVSPVRVSTNRGVEFETVGDRVGLVAYLHRIIFAAAEIEFGRSFLGVAEQVFDGRDRAVVKIR